ncbi:hypothetical protein V6N11_034416 [Hibiscus sabdariffa]|uniref:Uncharacterized protein n=1 Tax=Hibiscus sabdariffa TaxID=183260 RepID=A0ABR2NMG7_9ROSI
MTNKDRFTLDFVGLYISSVHQSIEDNVGNEATLLMLLKAKGADIIKEMQRKRGVGVGVGCGNMKKMEHVIGDEGYPHPDPH